MTSLLKREVSTSEFPLINHINDVLPAIAGAKEYAVTSRPPFTYVCYKRVQEGTFPPLPKQNLSSPEVQEQKKKAMLRRECRGLAFDNRTGEIVSRSFHKFFNIGENEDSTSMVVDQLLSSKRKWVLEKLDGSMCTPILEVVNYFYEEAEENNASSTASTTTTGSSQGPVLKSIRRLRFRTKMGFDNATSQAIEKFVYGHTEFSKFHHFVVTEKFQEPAPSAELLVKFESKQQRDEHIGALNLASSKNFKQKKNYIEFAFDCLTAGYSPIFEFFGKEHRIIVDYGAEFMKLLAMRHINTGGYIPYDEMRKAVEAEASIECAPAWTQYGEIKTAVELLAEVKERRQIEGFVLRFEDGTMFKTKCKWYSELHRCKQHIKWNSMKESHVWNLVLDNKVDDTVSTLDTEQEKKELIDFNNLLFKAIAKRAEQATDVVKEAKAACPTKKDFATWVYTNTKNETTLYQRLLFRIYDGADAEDELILLIMTYVQRSVEEARKLLGDPTIKFQMRALEEREAYKQKKMEQQRQLKLRQAASYAEVTGDTSLGTSDIVMQSTKAEDEEDFDEDN